MSTYLDKPLQLPAYVPTVPIELMTRVGMMKQAKYDSNHQDIQDQLDRLGQLPIIKDADREVIASKMKDVVTKLNEFSGQDLGDSRVANQLLGLTSGIYNDEDIYKRISANQAASTQLKKIQETKDENPDEYSPDNEHVFMKQFNDWMSNPNKKSFNATYTPYYNPSGEYNQIIDDITKNPDIKYRTNPDGSRSPYGPQELKEVTATKIAQALQSRLSDRAKAQMQIEYQAALDRPDFSAESAIQEVSKQVSMYDKNINEFTKLLPTIKKDSVYKETQQEIARLQEERDAAQAMQTDLTYNGDASKYYTFGKFAGDKLGGMARAFAYKQEGKPEYDKLFLMDYQYNQKVKLAKLKAELTKTINSEPAAINTLQKGIEELHVTGQAEFAPEQVYAMQNISGKPQADGSVDAVLGGKQQYLDIQPMVQALGLQVPQQKIQGYNDLMSKYTKWTKTKDGQTAMQVPAPASYASGGGYDIKIVPKSMDEYINYTTTKPGSIKDKDGHVGTLADDFTKTYGWDINNPTDMANVKHLTTDPAIIEGLSKVTTMLEKRSLKGVTNIIPQDGPNTIAASNGTPYNKFYVQMTSKELEDAFGNGFFTTAEYKTLKDKEIIKSTGKYTKKKDGTNDKEVFQVPISLPVTKDLGLVNAEVVEGNNVLNKHAGVYEANFTNKANLLNYTKDVIRTTPEVLSKSAKSNIQELVKNGHLTPSAATQYQAAIDESIQGLDNAVPSDVIKKKAILKAWATATSVNALKAQLARIEELSKDLQITKKATDFMSETDNND